MRSNGVLRTTGETFTAAQLRSIDRVTGARQSRAGAPAVLGNSDQTMVYNDLNVLTSGSPTSIRSHTHGGKGIDSGGDLASYINADIGKSRLLGSEFDRGPTKTKCVTRHRTSIVELRS